MADGTVIGITTIPGYDNMVIVQHGKYYSVYSKLVEVNISKGQKVKAGERIGQLKNKRSAELHFEFWEGKKKLNPELWLK